MVCFLSGKNNEMNLSSWSPLQLSYNQVVSSNGIAGLLGASPGASTAVQVALDVTRWRQEMWSIGIYGGGGGWIQGDHYPFLP